MSLLLFWMPSFVNFSIHFDCVVFGGIVEQNGTEMLASVLIMIPAIGNKHKMLYENSWPF